MQHELNREPEVYLRDYWNVVSQKKWRIAAFAVAASVLAVLVVFAIPPSYTATAEILIEAQDTNIVPVEDVYRLDAKNQQHYDTQIVILNARPLVEQVISDLNILRHPEYSLDEPSEFPQITWPAWLPFQPAKNVPDSQDRRALVLSAAVREYYSNLAVGLVGKSQLVRVQFSSGDPVLAADVANAHVKAYIDSLLDARLVVNDTATTWMSEQLAGLQSKMLESEARLQQYREQEQLVDAEGLKALPASEINDLTLRLVQVRSELSQARIAYTQVYQGSSRPLDDLSGVPAVLEDRGVQESQFAEADAQRKVAELAERYGPKHTVMIAAQSELDRAIEDLRSQQRSVAEAIKNEFEAVRAEERELVSALNRAKQRYQEVGRKESSLMALQREADTDRSLYEAFYNRLTETVATGEGKTAPVRIISPAIVPTKPTKPKKLLIVGLVFVASILLGVLASLLLESLSNTIATAADVEKLNLPLLGMLPRLKVGRKQKESLIKELAGNKGLPFLEEIRTIRTGIALNSMDNPNRVILVTSALPGEGKSTVALNLAIAFARMENVLLIDADLRRPSIAKEYDLPAGRPGLTELISGKAKFLQCLVRREKENLDVLPSGAIPENPLGLLSAHQLKQLLQALRTRYDRIIIDSPPLLPVSDSVVLSTYADSVVFVVKSEATTVRQAQEAVGKLQPANVAVAGVVVNELDMNNAGYRRGYGYEGYSSDLPEAAKA